MASMLLVVGMSCYVAGDWCYIVVSPIRGSLKGGWIHWIVDEIVTMFSKKLLV